jgi:DNA polymerase delta subunit 1
MPGTGYYTETPVIVLDFKRYDPLLIELTQSSLYPSIIIAKNLCFSTLLINRNDLPPDQYHKGYGPEECYFASADVKPGVLPQMLIHLLEERVKVKDLMKSTSDNVQRLVLDGRQRAIKVAANAIYGATGAPSSKLQCLPIAETTIVLGAKYLTQAADLIKQRYSEDVKVVYGDTDSVFCRVLSNMSVAEAFKCRS